MNVKRFTARTSRDALRQVREALGNDAVVLSTKPSGSGVEVLAMAPEAMQEVRQIAALPATVGGRAEPTLAATSVDQDVAQMQMSTLSFQDYVRTRMLKKRRAVLDAAAPSRQAGATAPIAGHHVDISVDDRESFAERHVPVATFGESWEDRVRIPASTDRECGR